MGWEQDEASDIRGLVSKLAIETKLLRYLGRWPEGLSTGRMRAWIASCSKDNGYTHQEYETALTNLRDAGRVACTNGNWWLKDLPSSMREQHGK